MATLERLGVQGIRCFAPDHLEVIAFEKPLTVIVGHNGAGKTTVVECLKFATTGELPPCVDRGRGWVFDPRLLDAAEVKAQVRLRIHTKGGKELTVVRSMQLSQTVDRKGKTKATFKQLEPYLQLKDSATGQKASIGNKCADIDLQLPGLLGIHRAVLEHVVFCHQEESCWPLSDMQVLKKKFDQLFGATRYVKALESIRAIRKQHVSAAKDRQHDLQLVAAHRRQARLLLRQLEEARALETEEEEQLRLTKAALETHASLLRSGEEAKEQEDEIKRNLQVASQLVQRLAAELADQQERQERERREEKERERQRRRTARIRLAERRRQEIERVEDSISRREQERDEAERARQAEEDEERVWQKEEEEEEKFRVAVEQESYRELVELAKDIEQQFAAKKDRLAALEGELQARENESSALTERLHAEQDRTAEAIRAEERRNGAAKERRRILEKLFKVLRGDRHAQEHDDEEEETFQRFASRSDREILEDVETQMKKLQNEKEVQGRDAMRVTEVLKLEARQLQRWREELASLQDRKARRRKKEELERDIRGVAEEEERQRREEEAGSQTCAAKISEMEAALKRADEDLQKLRGRRRLLERRRRVAEEQKERQMQLQLARQRIHDLEKEITEKEAKFLQEFQEVRDDLETEDSPLLHFGGTFEEAATLVASAASRKEAEKAREHHRTVSASLNSCRGQAELGASSLRALLLPFCHNLLRAASFSSQSFSAQSSSPASSPPGSSPSPAAPVASVSGRQGDASEERPARGSAWPPHLGLLLKETVRREREWGRDPSRRLVPSASTSSSRSPSSASAVSSSGSGDVRPEEDALCADARALLEIYEEGRRSRAEADVAREDDALKREAGHWAALYAISEAGGTNRLDCLVPHGWLRQLAKESEEASACALCRRAFLTRDELEKTMNEIEQRLQALPQQVRDAETRQREIQKQLDALQEERLLMATLAKQKEEIAQKTTFLQTLRQNLHHLKGQVQVAARRAEEAARREEKIRKLVDASESLREVKTVGRQKARGELETKEAQLREAVAAAAGDAGFEAMDETGSPLDLQSITKEFEACDEEQSKLYTLRDVTQARLNEAVRQRFVQQQRKEELRRRREDLRREEEELESLEHQISKTVDAMQAKERELPAQRRELASLERRLQEKNEQLRREEQRRGDTLRAVDASVEELSEQQRRLGEATHAVRQAEAALREIREKKSTLAAELGRLQAKREEVNADISRMKKANEEQQKACARGQRFLTIVKNKVALLHRENELEQEKKKIDALAQQLRDGRRRRFTGASGRDGEDEEREEGTEDGEEGGGLERELRELRRKCEAEKEKKARLEGSLVTRRERVKEIEKELAGSAVYNDVEEKYRSALVDAEIEAMAAKDLDRYHRALDKALMKYHSMKMQEINATMKELWQTMYTGHDIDFIAIRSDTEEQTAGAPASLFGNASSSASAPAAGQRSYNYRVVMVKGGVELDMRGRCSAGQKILASLIIRLALAETFCVHCGVLALDEPTTNLDRFNCESLAKALAALVEARRTSASFQLILITHDEQFVMKLARHGLCDKFYKITKALSGDSRITCCDIQGF
ncbi:RecF/RecN/SMC N terminal domain-containing protein [Toxoplasma gondii TgCatPRC2]|uniref:RecF/RecN/SMC N terminal domain-containing protein n=1 Tax=Toxoplasma gondii TgCatPRC2 TaxID=1130821 RepID=A0A151H2D8_TOXGO|nr:RecF/RecN/SMC N terminal domain-containing protein [Toxoplasma gondii TgCatPRC2]